jgi:phage/plasmid-associated DNA primase
MDEPEHDDTIHVGFMKNFTGGDRIMARALFRDPIYFIPQFKPFMLCNKLPKIKANDEGTWRRIKVLRFSSKFILPADYQKYRNERNEMDLPDNHFYANVNLAEELKNWKECFMALLLKHYCEYVKSGRKLIHPPEVTIETDNYRRNLDLYHDFIKENLVKVDKIEDNGKLKIPTIKIGALRETFNNWHKKNCEGKPPEMREMKDYLEKNFAETFKGDTLSGYIWKHEEPEDEDDE